MREDKQFFNGIIVGAIIFAFVMASIVLYSIRPSNPQRQLPLPRSWAKLRQTLPMPEAKPAQAKLDLGLGQITYLDEDAYTVAAAIDHPQHNLVFRALKQGGSSFECLNDAERLVFTFWKFDGQQLHTIDAEASAQVLSAPGCFKLVGWSPNQAELIFSDADTDLGAAYHRIWSYDLESKSLKMDYQYEIISAEDGKSVYHVWTWQQHRLMQQIVVTTGQSSALYRLAADQNIAETDLSALSVAFETSSQVKTDLLSAQNQVNFATGLTYIINGQQVTIPWTPN